MTKVFGLGLSKTGTSSLTDALNILGIRTIHYPHDEKTYEELRSGNYYLSILNDYNGVTDISVAPYFEELDRAYPGSKFILTVREKNSWLRSIETHWRLLMESWDAYPQFRKFHEFISKVVYGSVQFDRDRFSNAYDTHVRKVRRYFERRPKDLLIIDICAGEGWEKLCPFLGVDVPQSDFPHANEWMHMLLQANAEIAELIPPDKTLILVDEQGFGKEFAAPRRALPFLERNGQYWGAPVDDATAIRELERLRSQGASFIAFGWPAFWWLDHYTALRDYIRTNFRLLSQNERLVVYDLRSPDNATITTEGHPCTLTETKNS